VLDIAGKRVVSLAVGSVHVLALTDEGEVYGWGRNDYAQVGETTGGSVLEPTLITSLQGKVIIGIACGPTQVLLDVEVYLLEYKLHI
jgi:E3 ubiquitin-protein ligase HERC2